jgi:hypothetical protein
MNSSDRKDECWYCTVELDSEYVDITLNFGEGKGTTVMDRFCIKCAREHLPKFITDYTLSVAHGGPL